MKLHPVVGMELLSIGSVVKIGTESNMKFMIVGYMPENSEGERRDYSAIRYPMGVYDNRMFFFFDHVDIREICHKGHEDEEFQAMKVLIENFVERKNVN